ncbi:MAG: thiamine diphosphokinase [Firmicutes bacterium]|nr:thiamine diphosphokinase [Bacillota bacterium]
MCQTIGKSALILASGEDIPHAPPHLAGDALVICADGGAALAKAWELTPEIIIGDQDSIDQVTKEYWQARGIPFQRVPARKDETDLDLAVEYARQMGTASLTIVGGWGSRIDHALGNVELLYRLAKAGIENWLLTREHRLSAFCTEFQAQVPKGSCVSLIPLTPQAKGVSTTGLMYPLEGATLRKGSTLSISNVAQAEDISVRLEDGVLLAVI